MAIDDSGEWWTGTEAADIEGYLFELTRAGDGYPATSFRAVHCNCGSSQFRLERASTCTRRNCAGCGEIRYISRFGDGLGWEEAAEDSGVEPYRCVGCAGQVVNATVGFADYARHPGLRNQPDQSLPDAVLWYFVGVRCVECGILGCFNDGKVGRGPVSQVSLEITGEVPYKEK